MFIYYVKLFKILWFLFFVVLELLDFCVYVLMVFLNLCFFMDKYWGCMFGREELVRVGGV